MVVIIRKNHSSISMVTEIPARCCVREAAQSCCLEVKPRNDNLMLDTTFTLHHNSKIMMSMQNTITLELAVHYKENENVKRQQASRRK